MGMGQCHLMYRVNKHFWLKQYIINPSGGCVDKTYQDTSWSWMVRCVTSLWTAKDNKSVDSGMT